MANYIKSHSNFVLKKKHQDINSGTIYERDITTIGGLNQFAKGQVPIYKSGNFIITVNNEVEPSRNITTSGFFTSPSGDEIWTIEDVAMVSGNVKESSEVVLKQDYYSLKDFAYYGSCVELVRASISNIALNFPGSLYVPSLNGNGIAVYYETYDEQDEKHQKVNERLGGDNNLVLVSNPSNINIHTEYLNDSEITNPLKYMCNNGYKNYTDKDGNEISIWSVTSKTGCTKIGDEIAQIELNGFNIYAYLGNGNEIFYLTKSSNIDKLIATPKKEFFTKFYNSLDAFEKLLMNKDSKPKYSVLFEVLSENSFGYETELKRFTFPTKDGGYNLCINDGNYDTYVNSFMKYAEFYDEVFSDNLWRSMTHEAIKNFDWSFTREYSDGDDEDYIIGGSKIQNAIRLFGREFDEIKAYIDGIKGYNQITYGNDSMLPYYYLTDVLSDDGWDIVNISPFNEKVSQMTELKEIKPFHYGDYKYPEGYFKTIKYENGEAEVKIDKPFNDETSAYTLSYKVVNYCNSNVLINKIKDYISDKEYTLDEINNEFLKRMILNSRNIWRKKGTVEGIETLLAMFGLKSKRMVKDENDEYDYEIKEYVVKIEKPIEDKWDNRYSMNIIDWYNTTKTIAYDTDDYRQGIYHSYQGLPVRSYVDINGKYYRTDKLPLSDDEGANYEYDLSGEKIYLLPYFSKDKIIDGNPYYQMNGGWLKKRRMFNKNNKMFTANTYTETYRDIKSVESLYELISLPIQELNENDVYYVNDLSTRLGLVDGMIYDIYKDENGDEYIKTYISNNSIKVGYKYFSDEITVSSDKYGKPFKYVFSLYPNNTEVRIYLYGNGNIFAYGKYYSIGKFVVFEHDDETYSHYFQLKKVDSKMKIGDNGWRQLLNNDEIMNKIDSIVDKYSGNNPHVGHLAYDGGIEYLSYFTQLFKYAIENGEFNERCYDNFIETFEDIKNIGFKGLFDEETCEINYFDNEDYVDNEDKTYDKINTDFIKTFESGETCYETNENATTFALNDVENVEFESDKYINVKVAKIIFKNFNDNEYEIKFLDYVITNYMEQMIPSTLITEIELENVTDKTEPKTEYDNLKTTNSSIDGNSQVGKCDTNVTFNVTVDKTETDENGNVTKNTIELSSNEYDLKFGTTSGNYTQSSITQNETSNPKTWYYQITYNGLTSSGSFTQESGPCTPPTCTENDEWDKNTYSVSVETADKCDTYAKFNVTVSGKHINSDCSTSDTSATLSASDYTVLYGETDGNYTSSTFNANETNQAKTWYYKLSGKGAHSNLSKTGSFIQSAGPCTAPTCTEKNEWDENSMKVTVVNEIVSACSTSNEFKIYLEGIHTYSDCTTATTSTTINNHYVVKYGTTSGNYDLDYYGTNETNQQKTWYYKLTTDEEFGNFTSEGTFIQSAGPCNPTCTVKDNWTNIAATATTINACDTTCTLTVEVKGTHIDANCASTSISATVTSEHYSVMYGIEKGTYNLTSIPKNETNSDRIVYYKLTTDSTYNLEIEGEISQKAGPCTTVYVMQLTSGNTATSATFPGETESIASIGYICCYSTKNGVKQNVTASSDVDWLTVEENNDLPYDGANFNFKFTQTENTSTSARTSIITITQAESNKTVKWTIVQKGAVILINNCATVSVEGRKWTITLPYEATSDVTYTFNAVNGYSGGEDWTQTMTVLKGETTATATTTQFQFATSESEFSNVSPMEDDTYIYSDCDIHVESDYTEPDVTCDCEQASITCDPTYAYLDYNSGSTVSTTISTTLPSTNCNSQWIATDDSGGYVASGLTSGTITRSVTGTVTVHLTECQEKTAKFNVYYSRVDLKTDIDTTRQCPPPVDVEVIFAQYNKNDTHIADYTNSTSVSLNPEDKFNIIVKLTGTTADSGCVSRAVKIEIRSGQTLQYEKLYDRIEIGEEIIDTNATSINPFYGGGITVYIYTP